MTPADSIPGHPVHVIRRGVCRRRCFFSDDDRHAFLSLLARSASAERCALHAYVLMQNHVHLLLTPARRSSITELMRGLASPQWESRFETWPVYPRRYLLVCMRY